MTNPNGFGLTDEQAANEERHQQSLDRFFDPETREPSARPAQPMAAPAGMPGASPGAFANPQPVPHVPFDVLVSQLQMQPGMMEHLDGIDLDGDGVADIQMGPPPPDPMGRMQWQAMGQRAQAAAQARMQQKVQRRMSNNRRVLDYLKAHDPLFQHVTRWMDEFMDSLPGRIGEAVTLQIARTPGAYLEMYQEMRAHFVKEFGLHGGVRGFVPVGAVQAYQAHPAMAAGAPGMAQTSPGIPSGAALDPRERIRRAVAGRLTPLDLERAGVLDDERGPKASREAERQALLKRMRAGKAREGDSLRFLELSGL